MFMDIKSYRRVCLIIIFLSLILIIPRESFSSNYDQTYTFSTKVGIIENNHKIHISVPSSVYDYYQTLNPNTLGIEGFSKFVTPNVFRSVAENIQNVTSNNPYSDEIFANVVLDIVHQIPYQKTSTKFPAETIFENSGDCDTLSLLTASIMKAGNLDVVLLFYEDYPVNHMNIGVHLPRDPIYCSRRDNPLYYEYDGKKYFTAETTGENWRVGDQPQSYIKSEPKIIPINNNENASIAEISSSLDNPLIPSLISLSLIPEFLRIEELGTNITIVGSISPVYPKQKVIVNVKHETNQLYFHKAVTTDEFGNYTLPLNLNKTGKFTIQTSWNGINNYAGSDSDILTVNIGLNQFLDKHEVIQTETVGSDYIQIPTLDSLGSMILSNQQIKEILEKNFTGADVFISNEFIILGSDEPFLTEQIITIPEFEQTIVKRGNIFTRKVPEQIVTIPNYRSRLDNHLEFTLIKNGKEDYSLTVRLLDNYDLTQIIIGSDVRLINASSYVKENLWYHFGINFSEDQIIVELFDENGVVLTKIASTDDPANSTREYRILMKYDPDSIIVLKNLQTTILDQPIQLVKKIEAPSFYVPDMKIVEDSELTEQTEIPEIKEPPAEELNQEFNFSPILILIAALSIGSIVAFMFRGFRKRKSLPKFIQKE